MRKICVILFSCISFACIAQGSTVSATLKRLFVQIPDSFFLPLNRMLSQDVKNTVAWRREMIDTIEVNDQYSSTRFSITSFDTINCYIRLLAKTGEPEGMSGEIAYWNRNDGTRLVMMTINYDDMCVSEQHYRYFWIDNGMQLLPVNENEVFPSLSNADFISAKFLSKHKKANELEMPYMIKHADTGNSLEYAPAFDYLFLCGEYFEDDVWYGLEGEDIIKREIVLAWNGMKFQVQK